jgi:hypothetical protein
MLPFVGRDLIARYPAWEAAVHQLGTVPTQAVQLWLQSNEQELGWDSGSQVTVTGFQKPFDTWSAMGHLLDVEEWPESRRPATIAYLCGTMPPPSAETSLDRVSDELTERTTRFLDHQIGAVWPGAVDQVGFRWDLLCSGPNDDAVRGPARLSTQYLKANVDPSDLYVQALPGSVQYRMAPGDTGVDNLVVAGDWTDCDLNAGCVEAATWSGRLAARAVLERRGSVARVSGQGG